MANGAVSVQCLDHDFFARSDVLAVAKDLLGKELITFFDGQLVGGMIVETEAYAGIEDRASHAYGGRRTLRNEAMYGKAGRAYVYFCYGMHHLFNVVTGEEGIPQAVLIRALVPTRGLEIMRQRRRIELLDQLTSGPGKLCQALGIQRQHNELSLRDFPIMVCEGKQVNPTQVYATPRIGVDYAGEHALLPYRFVYRGLNHSC